MMIMQAILAAVIINAVQTVAYKPPIWPPAFSVDFQEVLKAFGKTFSNSGAWFYDFPNGRARFDHLRGQRDDFCFGQKLSDNDPNAPCSLLFTNHSDMYVYFPEAKTCCNLCGAEKFCTVLKPTWMSNGTFIGDKTIQGSVCHGWMTPGFDFTDELYVTDKNVLCEYYEKSYKGDIEHTITFNQDTYKIV